MSENSNTEAKNGMLEILKEAGTGDLSDESAIRFLDLIKNSPDALTEILVDAEERGNKLYRPSLPEEPK